MPIQKPEIPENTPNNNLLKPKE